jgi:hypothetical protein
MVGACGLLLKGSLLAYDADPAHTADSRMDPAGSKLEYIAMLEKVRVSGTFKQFDARGREPLGHIQRPLFADVKVRNGSVG